MIGPRITRSLLRDGLAWDAVDPDGIESRVLQDLLKVGPSFELVSELDYCQIGMAAIVMGDVNAVCTLECSHGRQLVVARAKRTIPIDPGTPFPGPKKTIGDALQQRLWLQADDVE